MQFLFTLYLHYIFLHFNFSVREVFLSKRFFRPIFGPKIKFSKTKLLLSYKTNFLPIFSAIIENFLEVFLQGPKNFGFGPKTGKNGYFRPNLSPKWYFWANFLHFWLKICKYIKTIQIHYMTNFQVNWIVFGVKMTLFWDQFALY